MLNINFVETLKLKIMPYTSILRFDKYFERLLVSNGFDSSLANFLNIVILSIVIAVIAVLANYLFKKIIIRIIKYWVDKSTNEYDDVFYEKGVFNKLSHLAPALLISYLAPIPLAEYKTLISFVKSATDIYILVVVLMMLNSVINALHDIYDKLPSLKNRSIKGYIQLIKSIVFFIGALMILSVVIKKDLSSLFAGLTAFAAVLLFVFKDPILGLIAGIQISANDILRVGDYIEMPNRNTDGTVTDITLSTVKILNANRTITTIPTYAFVSESFWNWRGLESTSGRRIKRHLKIDMNSIKYCDDKLVESLKKIDLMKSFFEKEEPASKRYTNSTLFRIYTEMYLKSIQGINIQHTFMVRHLQPTEHGLPLEIYVYTNEKNARMYEIMQADIFDHLIAMMPFFELKVFQHFTGIK
jgi:miniconductance mechanosensitive channel